jgi:hypothetical protein
MPPVCLMKFVLSAGSRTSSARERAQAKRVEGMVSFEYRTASFLPPDLDVPDAYFAPDSKSDWPEEQHVHAIACPCSSPQSTDTA